MGSMSMANSTGVAGSITQACRWGMRPNGRIPRNIGIDKQCIKRPGLKHVERDRPLGGRGRSHDGDVLQVGPADGIGHVVGVVAVQFQTISEPSETWSNPRW